MTDLGTNSIHGELASGVVNLVKPNAIHISFEDSFDELLTKLSDDDLYNIIKLANDVTYKRLRVVLDRIKENKRFSILHNALFGCSSLSPPHQSLPPKVLDNEGNIRFANGSLNQSQKDAIKFALLQRELAVIHGPPGTGKTTTIVEYIFQEVKSGSKILACAPSNVAVDNLVKKLAEISGTHEQKVRIVRLGHPARVQSLLQKHSLDAIISQSDQTQLVQDVKSDIGTALSKMKKSRGGKGNAGLRSELKELKKELREREKQAIKEILSNADVVLSTLTSATPWDGPLKHLKDDHFSVAVIDECSQSLEMACWIPMLQAKKVILAGDHKQLPPTIMSSEAASKGLSFTLMERVIESHEGKDDVVRMLSPQYRMNENIMKWSSDTFYKSHLKAADSVQKHLLCDLKSAVKDENTEIPLLLIDTTGCEMHELESSDEISKANEGEVALVVIHVKKLIDSGIDPIDIAVITPYNLQVELIRLQLHTQYPQLEIRSVDGFQGREKEAVVISLVRSNSKKEIGFLSEIRRLNVAVTRAKRHVALICDVETVSSNHSIKELTTHIEKDGEVRSAMQYQNIISDQGSIERPEGLELISNDTAKSSAKGDKKPRATKSRDKATKNAKEKSNQHKHEKSASNTHLIPQKTEEETITKRKELTAIIEEFFKDKSRNKYKFSSDLNSHDRMLVHEIAEEYELSHESVGEGKSRFIILKKKESIENSTLSCLESNLGTEKERYNSDDYDNVTNLNNSAAGLAVSKQKESSIRGDENTKPKIDNVSCCGCQKEIPKQNIELHKIRCNQSKNNEKVVTRNISSESKSTKKTKSKKKEARMKEEDDIDKLLESFNKLDNICNAEKVSQGLSDFI